MSNHYNDPNADYSNNNDYADNTQYEYDNDGVPRQTWTEEVRVRGRETVQRVKDLLEEGNVRRIIVRRKNGDVLMEFPLTAGVVASSAMLVFAPMFAALGALVAFVAEVRIEIVRSEPIEGVDVDEEAEPDEKPKRNTKNAPKRKERIEID